MNEKRQVIAWGRYELDFSLSTAVMGILNITPDSFSDGGSYNTPEEVAERAKLLVRQGADILDIGGESTRPGAVPITAAEELRRVIPAVQAVRQAVDVPLSVDTYKAEVAKQALDAGADMINDVWGAKKDVDMAAVAAAYDVPIVLMHNRNNMDYVNLVEDVKNDLNESIEICLAHGVKKERIILDPGIGFAKTYEDNIHIMRRLEEFKALGYPLLLGTSRKSLISKTLDLPVDQRVEGTGATVCLGIEKGSDIIRVHDVLEMSRMAKMMDVMLGKGNEPLAPSGS
ncbi:dihydropteroate synthase [Salisediminibacterium halotolerans]|uniref:dihydropteroate synthase n=1 Tax=Salisediminibacterium halotolerans TaxID=517425 RepID=UPI000EB2407D|nr:dihydropteroate synthase [Salisediminibacterium halotolerans]RLJ80933.1 dihydropteroate synthase [Actinophytocola xinjiangensis]RPE83662.1 dihydropteroate synthase [Salisediminibacterium halotolerans]TWG37858.1 dihydropteroate synthase [Salisediminibacterium halotolerans]GEL06990.1 dihydropteroate synthase [Salisediminibacterium halotolerans]